MYKTQIRIDALTTEPINPKAFTQEQIEKFCIAAGLNWEYSLIEVDASEKLSDVEVETFLWDENEIEYMRKAKRGGFSEFYNPR